MRGSEQGINLGEMGLGVSGIMKKMLWAAISILWCGVIYLFTQLPVFTFANTGIKIATSMGETDWRVTYAVNFAIRKGAHFILFALLAMFIKVLLKNVKGSYGIAWLCTTSYGIVDELHQLYIPGRGSSVLDVLIDSIGGGAGLVLYYLITRTVRRRRRRGIKHSESG